VSEKQFMIEKEVFSQPINKAKVSTNVAYT